MTADGKRSAQFEHTLLVSSSFLYVEFPSRGINQLVGKQFIMHAIYVVEE